MKTKLSKIALFLFCGLSLAVLAFIGTKAASGATLEALQERIEKLNEEREELEKKSQKYRNQISQKKEEIRSLESTVQSLRAQESKLRVDINLTENRLARTREQIKKLELEIAKKREDIGGSKRILSRLIRSYARKEEISTMEVVFSKADISDLLDRVKDLSLIQENMQKRLTELKETKEDLDQSKSKAEKKRKNLEQLREQKEAQRVALQRTEAQKESYLSQTRQEKNQFDQNLRQIQQRKRELLSQLEELQKKAERRKNFQVFVNSGKDPEPGTKLFQWPESGAQITQAFGDTEFARNTGFYPSHHGLDMAAGGGTAIKAAAEGEVIASGSDSLWGNWVAIKHEIGLVTLYAHMSVPSSVSEGEAVAAGHVIGYEGNTGQSTGSHLHFGVYESFFTLLDGGVEKPCYFPSDSCKPVDPQSYL